ncbi:MAG: dTDP-4-dehydrorhamnose reductase [Bacillota bacterium]|nr:dTDP-4-dehydrorhamnose reductase [Bacillota bacterium]
MRVLITGGKGQLGRALVEAMEEENRAGGEGERWEPFPYGREELDITSLAQVRRAVAELRPELVVHAAAFTNVDGCEEDPDRAFRVNALGTRNVALAAAEAGAALVYISTDFVFDGRQEGQPRPYTEFDRPNPLSVYGRSKLAGEEFVRTLHPRHYVVRTSWLFGHQGKNFVRTILELARTRPELAVVCDQVGSPTYAPDLARQLLRLVPTGLYGTYHISNKGSCSWYDFARQILAYAGRREPRLAAVPVRPISTAELGRPAPRPSYSVLRNYCLELTIGDGMRPYQEALSEYLERAVN